ncbi:hypothetical protein [Novosphingobium sp.]|uniref:hypothetical protein n=1 Tax=Novosphingobium sp. TaxID=1874826 RepID=UPI003D11F219
MKAVNFALAALAGLGLASSQVAFADTLPSAAVPVAAVSHVHPVKLVRLTEKRNGANSDVIGVLPIVIAFAAAGAVGFGVYEVAKKGSTGG